MKPTFEQEMLAANKIAKAMMDACDKKADSDEFKNYPDVVQMYAVVFCLVDMTYQMNAKLPWVIEVVKDAYKAYEADGADKNYLM
jgi:hypothetical protein